MRIFPIVTVLCLAMCIQVSAAISVRADSWPPYNGDPSSDTPGYGIEVLKSIFGEVDYQLLPWNRALAMCEKGEFDAVIGAYEGDAPGFVFPKLSIGSSQMVLVAPAGSDVQGTWQEALVGRKLGIIDGYGYEEELDAWITEHPDQTHVVKGDGALDKLLRMLKAGRIDLVVDDAAVITSVAEEAGIQADIKQVCNVGEPGSIFVAFSPAKDGSAELAATFDAGLTKLRESGKLASILGRYGLQDWAPLP